MGRGSGKGVATWPTQGTETELVPAGGRWDGPTGSFRGVWRASRSRPPRADRENTQPRAPVTRRSRVGRCVTAAVMARWLCPASCLVVSEKPWARDLTREAVLRALWAHSDTSTPRSPGPLAPRVQSSPLLTLHGTAATWNLPRSQCPCPTAMTGIVARPRPLPATPPPRLLACGGRGGVTQPWSPRLWALLGRGRCCHPVAPSTAAPCKALRLAPSHPCPESSSSHMPMSAHTSSTRRARCSHRSTCCEVFCPRRAPGSPPGPVR